MLGAMIGDIIGSRFEFDRNVHTEGFALFTRECRFTDDTVMTAAVAEALLSGEQDIRAAAIRCMRSWGKRFPHAGYGGTFRRWLADESMGSYRSYGNGAAMRVSAAGWLFKTAEETLDAAQAVTEVTHNHPEALKAAKCTAEVIFMARSGIPKEQILRHVTEDYGYQVASAPADVADAGRPVSCMDTMPKALTAVFCSDSYEQAVRTAVGFGGDTDTVAAIAGAMAEPLYGIPEEILREGFRYLPKDITDVIRRFSKARTGMPLPLREEYRVVRNALIRTAADGFVGAPSDETYKHLLITVLARIREGAQVTMPFIDKYGNLFEALPEDPNIGDSFGIESEVHLAFCTVSDAQGRKYFPVYTSEAELKKGGQPPVCMDIPLIDILSAAMHNDGIEGCVIDPFGNAAPLGKEAVRIVLDAFQSTSQENDAANC